MPYRPIPAFRRRFGVVIPLTAAIGRLYRRRSDGAYPMGAFYSQKISRIEWVHVGGIWYQPVVPERVTGRKIAEECIQRFMESVGSGVQLRLSNGTEVTWEPVPDALAQQLLQEQQ